MVPCVSEKMLTENGKYVKTDSTKPFYSLASRNSGIELLRFIAAISVIVWHCCSRITPNAESWLCVEIAFDIGVPIFMIITGYFTVNKKPRIIKTIIMFIIWFIIGITIFVPLSLPPIHINCIDGGDWKSLLTFKAMPAPWWYLYAYVFVMLITPAINLGIQKFNKYATLIVILFFMLVFGRYEVEPQYSEVFGPRAILLFITLYSAGGWLKLYAGTWIHQKKTIWICLGFMGLCLLLENIYKIAGFDPDDRFIAVEIKTDFLLMLDAIAMFIIFANIKFHSKTVNFLGKCTLPMYLFHLIFLTLFNIYIYPSPAHANNPDTLWLLAAIGFTTGTVFTFSSIICIPVDKLVNLISRKIEPKITRWISPHVS